MSKSVAILRWGGEIALSLLLMVALAAQRNAALYWVVFVSGASVIRALQAAIRGNRRRWNRCPLYVKGLLVTAPLVAWAAVTAAILLAAPRP